MKRSGRGGWLLRGLIALAVALGLALLGTAVLSRYAGDRVADAEGRLRADFEAAAVPPPPSSAASLELTDRFLAASRRLAPQWRARQDRSEQEPAPLDPAIDVEPLLAAAETPLAHESLAEEEPALQARRAARLLARVAAEAERGRDPALQARCAEALASIAGAFYRQSTLLGLLMGAAVEELELAILQRLVEEPTTPGPVLDRVAALARLPPAPLRPVWAGEALAHLDNRLPAGEGSLAERLTAPLRDAVWDLLRARTAERFGEFGHELDRPLTEILAAQPEWMVQPGPLDVVASMALPNTRHAVVHAKTLATVRELAQEAVAARRGDGAGELTRAEVAAALDSYWGLAPGQRPHVCQARTRDLLTWRLRPAA